MWGLVVLTAHHTEVTPPEVVYIDEYNVRRLGRLAP
jgi:hypothetical protein